VGIERRSPGGSFEEVSLADLRARVVEELEELGRGLRGSSEDEVDLFGTDDEKPRSENQCRHRVVELLRGHLASTIYPLDVCAF
jgi:hypothetical protein